MKHSDSIANLATALVAAQAEIRTIGYDAENPHFKSKFASLTKIIETVRPILAKHGLVIVQGGFSDVDVASSVFGVETILLHKSGEWMAQFFQMPLAKNDPQGAGSAITYGRRYGLSAILSLATDEDDDGTNALPAKQEAKSERKVERVASPPKHAPAGSTGASGAFLFPFGDLKGKPLKDIPLDKLESALTWAREKGKFAEFQEAAALVLDAAREATVSANGAGDERDLPF